LREVLINAGVTTEAAQWYILNGPYTELMVASPRELDRNHGLAARAMEVAVEHDIVGCALLDLSSRLELTDHLLVAPAGTALADGDPRSARRYLSRGRSLLGALGVWPWAHVADWRRTRQWWRDETVQRALISWYDRAWMDAAHRLAACYRARRGTPTFGVLTIAESDACWVFRASLAEQVTPPHRQLET
jgi:hypothetical protein